MVMLINDLNEIAFNKNLFHQSRYEIDPQVKKQLDQMWDEYDDVYKRVDEMQAIFEEKRDNAINKDQAKPTKEE